jgi:NAD(P) transhydrogenase subunit alpha
MIESFYLSNIDGIYVIIFSILIGIEVIKNVPAVLHTPLMSGANAISGIIVIGGIIHLLTLSLDDTTAILASSLAVLIGTINVTGGFFVTHRMLAMFTKSKKTR